MMLWYNFAGVIEKQMEQLGDVQHPDVYKLKEELMKIYIVMCSSDGEPVVAFTTRIDASNHAEELGSTGRYRFEVIEIDLLKDY